LDIGGTVDFTWGSDVGNVQTRGLEVTSKDPTGWGSGDYSAAFAQAYAEVAYKRWNVKVGKFYAPFGSSSYKSTENFFYSWASTWAITPVVGGGAYATYQLSDKLSVIGGWVMPSEIGHCSDNNFALGGLIWTPGKRLNVVYAFAVGDQDGLVVPIPDSAGNQVFVHSLVTTSQLSKRLRYVFDWTLCDTVGAHAYGLNNELIFQANKKWAFGTRFGMLKDSSGFYLNQGAGGCEWYTVALGANWTPNKWLTVKPEIRHDWTDKPVSPFAGEVPHQFSGGVSAVVKF
jgi:hypothetical protein